MKLFALLADSVLSGQASYLKVSTAQRNALQGELELASLMRNQLGANVELYWAVGGGWQYSAIAHL